MPHFRSTDFQKKKPGQLAGEYKSAAQYMAHVQFEHKLRRALGLAGGCLVTVTEHYTSQRCPGCLKLIKPGKSKFYRCPTCGVVSRDGNGARNIGLNAIWNSLFSPVMS